jgi:hypothetical protein
MNHFLVENKRQRRFPCLQCRIRYTHTVLQTARKKIVANPPTSILYKESYKMSNPIFATILLLLPTHAQESNPTRFHLCNTLKFFLHDFVQFPLLGIHVEQGRFNLL